MAARPPRAPVLHHMGGGEGAAAAAMELPKRGAVPMATLPIARGGGCHGNRRPSTRMRQGPREGGTGMCPRTEPHPPHTGSPTHAPPSGRGLGPGWGVCHMWGARGTAFVTVTEPGTAQGPAHPAQHRAVLLATESHTEVAGGGGHGHVPYGSPASRAPRVLLHSGTRGRQRAAALRALAQGNGRWEPGSAPSPGGGSLTRRSFPALRASCWLLL